MILSVWGYMEILPLQVLLAYGHINLLKLGSHRS